MKELKGIQYLRDYLNMKRIRVLERYKYYEMKDSNIDPSDIIPTKFKEVYKSTLGWCAKAVDSLADRLVFDKFTNDVFDMNGLYGMNNPDILFDSAVLSALISSCCFIDISENLEMRVIDGANATGVIDERTGLLTEGYAVLERDAYGNVLKDAYYTPGRIDKYDWTSGKCVSETVVIDNCPYVTLVPVIYRPDARRPFGHSRISRTCMNMQKFAKHTLTRTEVTSEFYSFPQKYILGLSPDAEPLDGYRATISSFLQFDKDEDGDRPSVGQFNQQSMTPHIDTLKAYASVFAGETDLTLDDLGFSTVNPSSADSIKASHENLRLRSRKAQRTFGSGFLNAGFVGACIRDNKAYNRNMIYTTTPTWQPIFEPDASMLSVIGDGAIKLNQAVPGFVDKDNLHVLTGITSND